MFWWAESILRGRERERLEYALHKYEINSCILAEVDEQRDDLHRQERSPTKRSKQSLLGSTLA
jgi:hypothetical protein